MREKIIVKRRRLILDRLLKIHAVRKCSGLFYAHLLHLLRDKSAALSHVLIHLRLRVVIVDGVQHIERCMQRAVAVSRQIFERDCNRLVFHVIQPERLHLLRHFVPCRRTNVPITITPLRIYIFRDFPEFFPTERRRKNERSFRDVYAVIILTVHDGTPLARVIAVLSRREAIENRRPCDLSAPSYLKHDAIDRIDTRINISVRRCKRNDCIPARICKKVHLIEDLGKPVAVP